MSTPTQRRTNAEQRVRRIAQDARGKVVTIHKPAMKPLAVSSWRTKAGWFAGGAASAETAHYLHDHRQKEKGMKIVKRDTTPLQLQLRQMSPEERRKHVRNNTIAGTVSGAAIGATTGAGIEGDIAGYARKIKYMRGASIGAGAGALLGGSLARHGSKKTRYQLELGTKEGHKVSKLYDPFNDRMVEVTKTLYADAVTGVRTVATPSLTGGHRAPSLALKRVGHSRSTPSGNKLLVVRRSK